MDNEIKRLRRKSLFNNIFSFIMSLVVLFGFAMVLVSVLKGDMLQAIFLLIISIDMRNGSEKITRRVAQEVDREISHLAMHEALEAFNKSMKKAIKKEQAEKKPAKTKSSKKKNEK